MITELADWTPDVEILGNVGFRRIVLTGNQKLPGHEHNFPHATAVVKGTVEVVFDGERKEVYNAPARFEVPARVKHEITALSDGAECWCIFGVRDESGEIAEMVEDRHRKDKFWHERLGGGDGA
jgi:quercetin dioxygenase-like cupin family protein